MQRALDFLVHRPIAVLMVFGIGLVFSLFALRQLPVSLLPPTELPEIAVRAEWPNASPEEIEQALLAPMRESFATLRYLEQSESEASSETGMLRLRFEYGAPMTLLYIEISEKIDRLHAQFPQEVPRPQVMRTGATDIPVVRLQVAPKAAGPDMVTTSELAASVLRKRLEAMEGVALVDLNGLQREEIAVRPHAFKLRAVGLEEGDVLAAIRQANLDMGALSVKDGPYRYFVQVKQEMADLGALERLPMPLPEGGSITLGQVATLEKLPGRSFSHHLFNGEPAILITIHKQAQAQMPELRQRILEAVGQFRRDFPQLTFAITQDQSALLDLSIGNLLTSLLFGGGFAFLVLFLFFGNYRLPLLIGISLPASLVLALGVFKLLGLSLNIISLSGLALGIGMLIDNAIIVIDTISRRFTALKAKGTAHSPALTEACTGGTAEVIAPLLSSVMTTLAVFVPLVLVSGLAGALFYDQALAVGTTLGTSLLVAFILIPLCYSLFFRRMATKQPDRDRGKIGPFREAAAYRWLERLWEKGHRFSLRRPWAIWLVFLGMMPTALLLARLLPIEGLPALEQVATQLEIDWNEPIGPGENRNRVEKLSDLVADAALLSEADVGIGQFLAQLSDSRVTEAKWYALFPTEADRKAAETLVGSWLTGQYPQAIYRFGPPPDAFTQLFADGRHTFELRFSAEGRGMPLPMHKALQVLGQFPSDRFGRSNGFSFETVLELTVKKDALARYQLAYGEVLEKVQGLFGDRAITEIRSFGESVEVRLRQPEGNLQEKLAQTWISLPKGDTEGSPRPGQIPLSALIDVSNTQYYRQLTADQNGPYHGLYPLHTVAYDSLLGASRAWSAAEGGISVRPAGTWLTDRKNLQELLLILGLSLLLLYVILAAQFESLAQPLAVLLTLPAGLGGSLAALWLGGSSLNAMSAIGCIVMLGIVVNDSILKVDTMNRLRKGGMDLEDAVEVAGRMRLKPILMTTLTTILALLPILFFRGIGADLQKPLVLAVGGGLMAGTLAALWFLPLAYKWLCR